MRFLVLATLAFANSATDRLVLADVRANRVNRRPIGANLLQALVVLFARHPWRARLFIIERDNMTILPETVEDKRFVLRRIFNDQIEDIQKVFNSCSYIDEWDPPNDALMRDVKNRIKKSKESKSSGKEIFDIKTIIKRSTMEIIGIIECCYGFPTQEYFCISDIEIKKNISIKKLDRK